jgi:hypothetical protein
LSPVKASGRAPLALTSPNEKLALDAARAGLLSDIEKTGKIYG